MVPFEIELELKGQPVRILAEQLDRLADEDGYIRFDIRTAERRGVIHVNVEQLYVPQTPEEAEAQFEAIHYPEQLPQFSFDEEFNQKEVDYIAGAVRQHLMLHRYLSNTCMSRTDQLPLL